MGIKEEFAKAKQLIQNKQYDRALNLLATIDHPKAKNWIGRVKSLPEYEKQEKGRNTMIGCGVVFLLAILCSLIFVVWSSTTHQSVRYNVQVACTIAQEQGFKCDSDFIYEAWPEAVQTCEAIATEPIDYEWYAFCLRENGVLMK